MTDQPKKHCFFCMLMPFVLGAIALTALYWYTKDSKTESIQNDLSFKSNELLKAQQVGGAVVNMDGRDAILTGSVVSQERSSEIEGIISTLDGIRIVDNQLEVVEPKVVEATLEPEPIPAPEPIPEPELVSGTEAQIEPEAEMTAVTETQSEAQAVEDLLQTLDLSGITFLFGSSEITPEGKFVLDDVIAVLTEHTEFDVAVEGHTDNVGNDDLNLQLSQLRAQSVLNYITSAGIQAERLKAVGFGETLPIYDNDTAQGRTLNRRIEFNVSRQR